MARPNNSAAIAGRVQGMREAKAAFQKMPEVMRDHLNNATETTVREIVRGGRARLQASPSIRTRNLYNHVGWSMNRKNGRGRAGVSSGSTTISNPSLGTIGKSTVKVKGILVAGKGGSALTSKGAKLDRPSRRAHFVEFGTRHMAAEPFMIPATEAEQPHYLDRCVHEGKAAEKDLANIGSRTL